MVSLLEELQNPSMTALYCEEQIFNYTIEENNSDHVQKDSSLPSIWFEHDLFWDDTELNELIAKQHSQLCFSDDGFSLDVRREAVDWILRVKSHFRFNALTTFLAVNYFDRFNLGFRFQRDKPWMGQLAAVACLSLAAKVEQTHVPLLLDLQVEESRFVFEAKTIQRMELLVLSSLNWRMNPVTPISFIDHIIRRLGLRTPSNLEFLQSCERLLPCVIVDLKIMCYPPSVLAAAIMLHVIQEVEPCNQIEYRNQLLEVLKVDMDTVGSCYKLLLDHNQSNKRKRLSVRNSPNCIIDTSFSCDSSNDSWAATSSSVSSSPEPLFKSRKDQVQQIKMPLINQVFVNVLSSPH